MQNITPFKILAFLMYCATDFSVRLLLLMPMPAVTFPASCLPRC